MFYTNQMQTQNAKPNAENIINSFSRILSGYLKRIGLKVDSSTAESWTAESLHELKFYPSVLLLMIKMSQTAREKLDSYRKNDSRSIYGATT